MSRKIEFIHKNSQANDKFCSQEAGSEGPPLQPGAGQPSSLGRCGLLGLFL